MITFKEATEGYQAHWEVSDPEITEILTEQFENRTGLFVSTINKPGTMPAQDMFHQGDRVVILLPLGDWKREFSYDGSNWYTVDPISSQFAGRRLNYILDGQTPFPKRWAKYTKIV